jgi:hypothetical protein
VLVDGFEKAGVRIARWNGVDVNGEPVASGVYFYRLRAAGFSEIKKMVLLR